MNESPTPSHLNLLRVVHILQSELILVVEGQLVHLVLEFYHEGVFVLEVASCHENLLVDWHHAEHVRFSVNRSVTGKMAKVGNGLPNRLPHTVTV